jgi:hypothetical protein
MPEDEELTRARQRLEDANQGVDIAWQARYATPTAMEELHTALDELTEAGTEFARLVGDRLAAD